MPTLNPDIPHFSHPFVFMTLPGGGVVAGVDEQDEGDEIAACVERIVRTPEGYRDELPSFGIPQQVFAQGPLDTEPIRRKVAEFEPRADLDLSSSISTQDELVQTIRVELEATQPEA